MSSYSQRSRNLYNPQSSEPFSVSRSGIDLFLECPRCFYLDKKLGLGRPSLPGWSLNSAVDTLLKSEFDILRENGERHKLMEKYHIQAVPFNHPDLSIWRNNLKGAFVIHTPTNLKISGAIDDVWVNKDTDELYIVDYKSTSTNGDISLDDEYKQGYKRQMEVYQWIFRQMGFVVSNTGYFVFANALKNLPKFDGRLEFNLSILPYEGNDSWVEPTIYQIKECLNSNVVPDPSPTCQYCAYRQFIERELS